ncbi:MAG: SPFH/Band 7/PHB domain protein [Verrucomicrobiae bacterium]|nr:SPFH/Band 7/PHB domain protein [Verrucomicrobiae bacterium]
MNLIPTLAIIDPATGATIAILAVIAILVIIFALKGLMLVRQAETMVIERLGRYHRTLESGLNIIWPIIDQPRSIHWRFVDAKPDGKPFVANRITNRIDLREAVYDFARQNVITKDNVSIEINAVIYFQVTDARRAVYEIANLPDAIEKLTQTTLRNIIGELDLDETLVSRDTINKKLGVILDDATNKWGVKVNRVELQDIQPPADIQEAMEKQMRAERDRRAVILDAEGRKQAQILDAEGVRQSQINRAEGEKQAAVLRAQGEAEALERVAQAEAAAVRQVADSLVSEQSDPASYLIAMRYIEALKSMTEGDQARTVYMPYEATGILGSLGTVKDLFQGGNNALPSS